MMNSCFYMGVEIIQTKDSGVAEYFKDVVNYWDLANFFIYSAFFVIRLINWENVDLVISEDDIVN